MSEEFQLVVSDLHGKIRTERVALSPKGAHRYVIDDRDILVCQPPLFWQDIIEARETDDGRLWLLGVLERADPAIVVLELGPHLSGTPVTPLGDGRYRLEASQYEVEPPLAFHDVIEAELQAEARLRFVRLIQKSELEDQVVTPAPELLETVESMSVLNWLTEQGGYWQRMWGNAVALWVPKHIQKELDAKLKQVSDAFSRGLIETGTADTAGRPYPVLVSLEAYRDPKIQHDPVIASVPPAAYLLFGKPHERGPLWRLTGHPHEVQKKKPEALEGIAMPPALKRRIKQWTWMGLLARQSGLPPGYSGFADEDSERRYLTEGWNLYRELAKVVREPLEFWDFATGWYGWWPPDARLTPGELGKGKDCRVLARAADYALIGRMKSANLLRRGVEESIEDSLRVGAHDPTVGCGVIAPDQSWCATGGSGVIVYELRPPWVDYDDKWETDQWFKFERESTVTQMEALDPTYIRLTLSKYGEPIRDRLLDLNTRRLV